MPTDNYKPRKVFLKNYFIEKYDIIQLQSLVHSNKISLNDKKSLQRISKMKTDDNDIYYIQKIRYYTDNNYGRYQPQNGKRNYTYCYQNMPSQIRNFLIHDRYLDLDVVCSQPTIMTQIHNNYNIQSPQLQYYIQNREQIIKHIVKKTKTSRKQVKTLFNIIMNGGTPDTWFETEKIPKIKLHQFVYDLQHEQQTNINKLIIHYPQIIQYVKNKKTKQNKPYHNGSIYAEIYHTYERNVLDNINKYCESKSITITSLIHDGLLIEKKHKINDQFLLNIQNYIKQNTNLDIRLIFKPTIIPDKFQDIHVTLVIDDTDCANHIIKEIGYKYRKSTNYTYHLQNGIWIQREMSQHYSNIFDSKIRNYISSRKFIQREKNIRIGRTDSSRKAITSIVLDKLNIDTEFEENTRNSNIKHLFFNNGVFSFTHQKMFSFDSEYVTKNKIKSFFKIQRNFINKNDMDSNTLRQLQLNINKVHKIILDPIFNNNQELKTYFLQWFSRGLAGHIEDKSFGFGLGFRNSGKSILIKLFQNAFGPYVSLTNGEHLLMKPNDNDISKSLGWCIDLIDTRICFMSEIAFDIHNKNLKINGNLIKQLSSGGDQFEARKLYKNITKFVPQTRFCLMCNDLPSIAPTDAKESIIKFDFPVKFVNQNQLSISEFYKLKNPQIPEIIKQNDIINAFTYILLEHYKETIPIMPNCVIEDNEDFENDGTSDYDIIREHIVFDKNLKISCKELINHLKTTELNVSNNKLTKLLKAFGVTKKKYRGAGNLRNKFCYFGCSNK